MKVLRPIVALAFAVTGAWAQAPLGVRVGTPQTPKTGALIDLTGYWVSLVGDDARSRLLTPPKGDFADFPLNADGLKLANAWDPARDEAAGEQCKSYGAAAIMGIPGRFHITWDNDTTLKVETEAGTQIRLLHFGTNPPETEAPSWQGYSMARWEPPLKYVVPATGSLKVKTVQLLPGYLRRNGVPYSAETTVAEYFDLTRDQDGTVLVVNTVVEDPVYLTEPYRTSTNLRKLRDGSGWNPSGCSAR